MITFKALRSGEFYEIPDFASISAGLEFNDIGGFRIQYASNGTNASQILEDTVVVAYSDGIEMLNGRWRLLGGEDVAVRDGATYVSFAGKSLFDVFNRTVVLHSATESKVIISDQTPGKVLIDLFQQAQGRGAMTGFSWDFTATKDSAGQPWAQNIWGELERGKEYYSYIQQWIEQGKVEIAFQGMTIRAFNEGTGGTDRSNTVELLGGRHYEETPIRRSIEDRASRVISLGDEGKYAVAVAGTTGPFGFEEISVQQGGAKDDGVLSLLAQNTLETTKNAQAQHTRKVNLLTLGMDPGATFRVGDWISERVGGTSEKYRVRAITLTFERDSRTAALVLNDKINERDIKLKRMMSGLGGSSGGGKVNTPLPPVIPPPEKDVTVPKAPTGLILTTETYADANEDTRGVARMQWVEPTENTDGSALADFDHYEVWWKNIRVEPMDIPDSMGEMSPYPKLNSLLDRRGDAYGWIAGDGAASVRRPDGKDIWIFGDSVIGRADTTGKIIGGGGTDWWMVNNALVETDPDDASYFRTLVGAPNLLPTELAVPTVTPQGTFTRTVGSVVPDADAFGGTTFRLTGNNATAGYGLFIAATGGPAHFTGLIPGDVYTVRGVFRSSRPTLAGARIGLNVFNTDGTGSAWKWGDVAPVDVTVSANHGRVPFMATITIPEGKTRASLMLYISVIVQGETLDVDGLAIYKGDQRHQSWSLPSGGGPKAIVRPEATGWRSKDYQNHAPLMAKFLRENESRRLLALGDSITESVGVDNPSKGYVAKLDALIRNEWAKGTTPRTVYIPAASHVWVNNGTTYSATKPDVGDRGGLAGYTATVDAGEFVQFASRAANEIVVYYSTTNFFAGTFEVLVDGVIKATQYTYVDGYKSGNKLVISGLAAGNHVVKIQGKAGSVGGSVIEGVEFRVGSGKQSAILNGGHAGGNLRSMLDGDSAVSRWESIKASEPGHGMILIGSNDLSNDLGTGRTAAQFAADATEFAVRWRSNVPNANLTFFMWIDPWAKTKEPYANYVSAMRSAFASLAYAEVVILADHLPVLEERVNLAGSANTMIASVLGNVVRTLDVVEDGKTWTRFDVNTVRHGARLSIATSRAPLGEDYTSSWEMKNVGTATAVFYLDFNDLGPTGDTGNRAYTLAAGETRRVYVSVPNLNSGSSQRFFDIAAAVAGSSFLVRAPLVETGMDELPYFDGATAPAGWRTQWEGTANASASMAVKTDWLGDGVHPNELGATMVADAIMGRLQNPNSDYYWLGDGWTANGKVYSLSQIIGPHWPTPDGWNFSFKNRNDLMIWDAATMALEKVVPWLTGEISWSNSTYVEGAYVYVFGQRTDQAACVMRAPLANPLTGMQAWNGTAWVADLTAAAGILTGYAITGMRKMGTEYHVYYTDGFGTEIFRSNATKITGPFLNKTSIYSFPDVGGGRYGYIARPHPQFDSPNGLVTGYSRNTTSDWTLNVTDGVPRFARGSAEDPQTIDLDEVSWTNVIQTTEAVAYASPLLPGTAFTYQTRAVDSADPPHYSAWAEGPVGYVGRDSTPPNAPSKPLVQPVFQGLRAVWDGLDYLGALPPKDWDFIEFHVNTYDGFTPTAETLLDTMPLISGGAFAVQGLKANTEYFVLFVAVDRNGNKSAPSETGSATTAQLVNIDLPDRLVTGAKLAKEAVNATNLTVGALSDNMMRNGNMEEWDDEVGLPFGFKESWWGDNTIVPSKNTSSPISGNQSLRVTVPKIVGSATGNRTWMTPVMPIAERGVYSISMRIRTNRVMSEGEFFASFDWGNAESDVNGFNGTAALTAVHPTNQASGTEWLYSGAAGVGDNAHFGAVVLHFVKKAETTTDLIIDIDDISLQRVAGGADIGYAAIWNAHISYLDLNEGNVSKLNVGNLLSGISTADVSIAGRFKTMPIAGSQKRVEFGADGIYQYRDDGQRVTQMDSNTGGIICRWFRTEASGARIELGTYGMGADTALMSFFPNSASWQFPPAFGFGGETRQGTTPGLAMHAGSLTETYYNRYGMNMIAVDQAGGIYLVTGNKLNGTESSEGAPIRLNAGGADAYIELKSGGTNDPAQLRLDPTTGESFLALNKGGVRFANLGAGDSYRMEFVYGTTWLGYNHLHIQIGGGGLRIGSTADPNAFIFKSGNLYLANGAVEAESFRGPGPSAAVLRTTGGNGLRFDNDGNPYLYNSGSTRANNAWWVDAAGLVNGGGDWGTPKIKVRAQDSYIQWDANGNAYVNGNAVKTFVIDHPLKERSNKWLVHATVEGPTADTSYKGHAEVTVGTPHKVTLPDYYEALNQEDSAVVTASIVSECEDMATCPCLPPALLVSRVAHGEFTVMLKGGDTHTDYTVAWHVQTTRHNAEFEVEVDKDSATRRAVGPYTYLE